MPFLRALVRLAGWLVLALALGFLGHSFWQSAPWTLAAARSIALALGGGTLAYGLAGFLPAEAWHHLLGSRASLAQRRHYHALYGRSQIAKYLPGNCFHFVGRQLLGRRLGHGHDALALASLAKSTLLLALAGAIALPLLGPELAKALGWSAVWPVLAALIAAVGLLVVVTCGSGALHTRAASGALVALRSLAARLPRAGLLHLAFFAVGGPILWTVAAATRPSGTQTLDLLGAVSAMALGWWAGFVAPGAPAGVGVREAVLVLTLEPQLGAEAALLVASALRVVTTLGDLLFFGLCCLSPARLRTAAATARAES